jgi:hypothetical protein
LPAAGQPAQGDQQRQDDRCSHCRYSSQVGVG